MEMEMEETQGEGGEDTLSKRFWGVTARNRGVKSVSAGRS
jgi:hypothetical protein